MVYNKTVSLRFYIILKNFIPQALIRYSLLIISDVVKDVASLIIKP